MNTKPNILIFSVSRPENSSTQNEINSGLVEFGLRTRKIPFIELVGVYKGTKEVSFLVEGFENRELIESLCKVFKQECYLESHGDRSTNLVYKNGSKVSIGRLTQVSEAEAKSQDAYSYRSDTKQYFISK